MTKKTILRVLSALTAISIFALNGPFAYAESLSAGAPPNKDLFIAGILSSNTPDTMNQKFENINAMLNMEQDHLPKRHYAAKVTTAPDAKLGKLGKVTVTGNKWVSTPNIQRYFKSIRPSKVLDFNTVQTNLNRLNSNKDIQATAQLKPGQSPDTTDLNVDVKDRHPFHLSTYANNFGTDNTGRGRYGAAFQHTNLLGITDVFTVGGQVGDEAWDLGVDYNLPVNRWGTRLGAGSNRSYNEVGGDFRALDVRGYTDIYSVYATHPVYARPNFVATTHLGFDWKSVENRNLTRSPRQDEIRVVGTGLRFEQTDAYGKTISPHSFNFGLDALGASEEGDRRVTAFGTGGDFFVYRGSIVREHTIIKGITLLGRIRGQASPDALPPTEQLRLGGAHSVRGYSEAEFLADDGIDGTLEIHFSPSFFPKKWTVPFSKEPLNDAFELIAFIDGGYGSSTDPFLGRTRARRIGGIGGGYRLHLYDKIYARFEWAEPVDGDRPQNQKDTSFYFGISAELF